MGTKKQAENVATGQLMALFGETPESVDKIVAESDEKNKTKFKQPAPLAARVLADDIPDTETYTKPKKR